MDCKHESFNANVAVARLEDTGRFMADVKINCIQCGIPMQFLGLDVGVNYDGARINVDGTEARLAIHPMCEEPPETDSFKGFSINKAL